MSTATMTHQAPKQAFVDVDEVSKKALFKEVSGIFANLSNTQRAKDKQGVVKYKHPTSGMLVELLVSVTDNNTLARKSLLSIAS